MKKPKLEVRPYKHHAVYKFCLNLRPFGKGRLFFQTRAEADAERLRQLTTLARHGREAVGLPQRELSDFISAKDKLAKYGETINDAVAFSIDYLERVRRHGITVEQLATELVEAKRKDGRSEIYLRDLRNILAIFSRDFGSRAIAGITVEEMDNYLRDLPGSPKTRTNFRSNIGVLFSFARGRRIIQENPIEFTAKPKLPDTPPQILTADETRALIEAAQQAPDVLPLLAIGAFAGLRDAEIKRLDWSEVKFSAGLIEVTGAKAKSARRRLVAIQPNLAAWLRPYSEKTGRVVPVGCRASIERVRKAAGLSEWPHNSLRHSFASYRLAATNNAPLVASELGHASPTMLFNTYRAIVTPDDAARYWEIAPTGGENVIPFANAEATGQ